ncbi:MAG: branched-chain amino acid ABC transporter permease [Alphaproteobacteria bacterium]|mgnify:CR=1 FL=1|jgi:branched-chain amino acid transport system permease protein|nr:branched-chain amino acid ABC transporter permease [Alphaproteobacteria bacterium]|tara:strand:- start:2476 stop:3486 length:1011 start_codon:yes stop_codon:yes gene_type:complete
MDFLNAIVLMANFVIVPALTYGSQLALGAIGVTLIYGVLRFANFAYGDLMAFGTMISILITWKFQSMGISFGFLPTALLALPFAIIATILVSLFFDKVIFEYYRIKKSPGVTLIVVSLGLMFVLNGIVRVVIGTGDRQFFDGQKFLIKANEFKELTGLNEGLAIKSTQLITLVTTIFVALLLFWFLDKTKTGKSMRAYSNNEDLALLSGIDPNRVVMITWIIASILATVAGTLYGLDKSFKPFTYFNNLLPIFAAAIVGGIGNPIGAFFGGFLVAFSEIMITYAYKKVLIYLLPENLEPTSLMQLLSTDYKFAVSFSILVIVLLFRPNGIFKGKVL